MAIALHLPRLNLDPKRIVANALVVSLHIVALALLMAPIRWPPPSKSVERPVPDLTVPVLLPATTKPPTQAPRLPVQPARVRTTAAAAAVALPQIEPEAPVLPDRAAIDRVIEDSGEAMSGTAEVEPNDAGTGLGTLSYAEAPPPRYPPPALRAGLEGEVLLRVLVDPRGRVLEVTIERSSGHRQLDLAALRQVQTRWRFHPAERNGQPIPAWGLVPIVFSLPQ